MPLSLQGRMGKGPMTTPILKSGNKRITYVYFGYFLTKFPILHCTVCMLSGLTLILFPSYYYMYIYTFRFESANQIAKRRFTISCSKPEVYYGCFGVLHEHV